MAYTNWKEQGDPFLDFSEELTYEWMKNGFSREQAKEWLNIGMKREDAGFCAWLRDERKFTLEQILNDEENLRKEYNEYAVNLLSSLSEGVVEKIRDFKHSHDYRDKLTSEQQSLINELISNQRLRNRYIEYGLCSECQQPNTNLKLCQPCNFQYLQRDFKNWTSGNQVVDEFIQKFQLNSSKILRYPKKVLEWIPYEKFTNIKHLADGGFGRVYKAEWRTNLHNNDRIVALKSLYNSQNITADFLQEITYHKLTSVVSGSVVNCLGISQDPTTKDYLMVMEYMKEGNLRQYLQNNREDFEDKFRQLLDIVVGLSYIHEKGLIHRDFHSGNILKNILKDDVKCYIADLGLSQPANETDDSKVYGVLPYVAPEVLCGKPYIQASDVYSFGIIVYEYISSLSPYHDIAHDEFLGLKVCQGLRPNLEATSAPQLLKDLIKKCWNADPLQRPTANELREILFDWFAENRNRKNTEFYQQCKLIKETEEKEFQEFCQQHKDMDHIKVWETFYKSPPTSYKTHPQAVYQSRLLPTKQITELLQKSERFIISRTVEFNIDELDEDLKEQEQISTQVQIEISPKNH